MSSTDEFIFLEEEEFRELSDDQKWDFVDSLRMAMKDLQIMAEKNCSDCVQYHLAPGDVNINFMFEDWRNCADRCDECGKEEQRNMCRLQFEIISHIAEEVSTLTNKFNGITKYLLKKDEKGKKFIKGLMKDVKASQESTGSYFQ